MKNTKSLKGNGKKATGKAPKTGTKKTKAVSGMVKGKPTNLVLAALTVGAAGVIGYFGLQYYKKLKNAKNNNLDEALLKIQPTAINTQYTPPPAPGQKKPYDFNFTPSPDSTGSKINTANNPKPPSGFPLKKGSKGENVKLLQQALINKFGKAILPKYGADGDFGSETQNALKKKGFPAVIDESTFYVITQPDGEAGVTSQIISLATKLHEAASSKNFSPVISLLQNINNKDEYQQVSNSFMQNRLNGVRQTLVNGLLSSFGDEAQKQKIRMEFIRMGLQYDGNKWSLSGFEGKPIVTIEPATVWITATQSTNVPAMMVLGNEVAQRLDFTLFENNNKYYLIKTQSIKYL